MSLSDILDEKHAMQARMAKECNYDPNLFAEKAILATRKLEETLNIKFKYYDGPVMSQQKVDELKEKINTWFKKIPKGEVPDWDRI